MTLKQKKRLIRNKAPYRVFIRDGAGENEDGRVVVNLVVHKHKIK